MPTLSPIPSYASIRINPKDPNTRSGDTLMIDKTRDQVKAGRTYRFFNKNTGFYDDCNVVSKKIIPNQRDRFIILSTPASQSLENLNAAVAREREEATAAIENTDWDRYSCNDNGHGGIVYRDRLTNQYLDSIPTSSSPFVPSDDENFNEITASPVLHERKSLRYRQSQLIPRTSAAQTTQDIKPTLTELPQITFQNSVVASPTTVTPSKSQSPAKNKSVITVQSLMSSAKRRWKTKDFSIRNKLK